MISGERLTIKIVNASSSSEFRSIYGPEYAIDGEVVTGNGYFFHSAEEAYPWLELDLGRISTVTGLTIYNRVNCCGERLRNLQIRAGSVQVPEKHKGEWSGNTKVAYFRGPGTSGGIYSLPFDDKISARYITFQLIDSSETYMQMNEVVVFGTRK